MGKEAIDLLKSADDLLDESFKMLAGAQPRLSPGEYDDYRTQHDKLYWMVVAVRTDGRDKEEQEGFFATPEEKQQFYSRVQKVFRDCRTYHTDVISVSRQAHNRRNISQLDNNSTTSTQIAPTQQATGSAQWVQVPINSRTSSMLDALDDQNKPESLPAIRDGESRSVQPFIATLAHIPQAALAAGDEILSQLPDDGDGFYQILICGNRNKRAIIVDPNLHYPNEPGSEDAEGPQNDILQVGNMMMGTDPQSLMAGHELIDSYQGPSFITSLISTFSLGTSGLTLGGMV